MSSVTARPSSLELAVLSAPRLGRLARRLSTERSDAAAAELDAAFLEVLSDLEVGAPFGFVEQYDGALVQDLRPAAGHETEQSSRGTVALELHTDDAFLRRAARPEHLAVLGVANPQRIPTYAVRIDDVLPLMSEMTIDALRAPDFAFAFPDSFERHGLVGAGTPYGPILTKGAAGEPEVAFAPGLGAVAAASEQAARHLARFRNALTQARGVHIALDAGQILLLSNTRCLHGRPSVDADRWMKRAYLREDLGMLDRMASTRRAGVYSAAQLT